jgi:small subunit ribosomal protein S13
MSMFVPKQVRIDENKKIYKMLLANYGIGNARATQICLELGISYSTLGAELHATQETMLRTLLNSVVLNDALRKETDTYLKNLTLLNTYRSSRHKTNLPVRGQRTHSNARTQRKLQRIKKDSVL